MSTQDPDYEPPAPADDPFAFLKQPLKETGRIKSRASGVFFLILGGAFIAWAETSNWMPRKVFFALVSLGPAVVWMGIGLIAFPLTGEQFKKSFGQDDQGFGQMWRAFPPVWKMWFVMTLVVMAAGFIYAIKVAG